MEAPDYGAIAAAKTALKLTAEDSSGQPEREVYEDLHTLAKLYEVMVADGTQARYKIEIYYGRDWYITDLDTGRTGAGSTLTEAFKYLNKEG